MFVEERYLLIMLALAVVALGLLLMQLRSKRKRAGRLERDATNLWRYHSDTSFERKQALGSRLKGTGQTGASEDSTGDSESKREKKQQTVAVIEFDGDLKGKEHTSFAKYVDEVIVNRDDLDEVVVVVHSAGGLVSPYGHAFAEMRRIRNSGLRLTVCVDVIAASGGYLMSLPAHQIIAAPLAIVGSIGVLAFVPNFRNRLVEWNIQPRTFTAGKFKHTVSFVDNASQDEVARFQEQLEVIHRQFSAAVAEYRPDAPVEQVTTGEHWTAAESVERGLGLVDRIGTSHDYLLERNREADLVLIGRRQGFFEGGLSIFGRSLADRIEARLFGTLTDRYYAV
ncbi:MAG: S49 family peptidase [Bdellovibrionales bacterium]|nr:S49 family peptidase [Bdellovibrionales bacterium]